MKRFAFALAALVAACPADVLAQGCAMCKTALDGQDSLTQAFNTSTILLMASPYTVVTTVGLWMFLTSRRSARLDESSRPTEKETEL